MRIKLFSIFSLLIVGFFLFLAFGSGKSSNSSSSGPNIEDESEIKQHIKGKWSTNFYEMGTTWYYRFEITDSKLTYWIRFGEYEWKQEPEDSHIYNLSHVIRDTYGAKFRSLSIENTDLGLSRGGGVTYENGCLHFKGNCLDKGW